MKIYEDIQEGTDVILALAFPRISITQNGRAMGRFLFFLTRGLGVEDEKSDRVRIRHRL